MKLSIIIPAYNEHKTIQEIIRRVKTQKVFNVDKEIIVVDDGSSDGTGEILKKIKGIKFYKHEKNKGKGMAIRTGLAHATGDVVLIQDADLELDPTDYPELFRPFLEQNARVVYGSRVLADKSKHSPIYYFGGQFVTVVANLLYGIHITDEAIGYKLFRREVINSLNLECERFEFCPEVTAKIAKRHIKIYEVPVRYNPRTSAEGKKLRIKDGIEAVWVLIKYKFRD